MLLGPEQLRIIDVSILQILDVFKLLCRKQMLLIFYLLFEVKLLFVLFSVVLLDKVALLFNRLRRVLRLNFWVLLLSSALHLSVWSLWWEVVFFVRIIILLRFFILRLRIQSCLSFSFNKICWHLISLIDIFHS